MTKNEYEGIAAGIGASRLSKDACREVAASIGQALFNRDPKYDRAKFKLALVKYGVL